MTSSQARHECAETTSQIQSLAAYNNKLSSRMCFQCQLDFSYLIPGFSRSHIALDLFTNLFPFMNPHLTSRRIRPRVECSAHYYIFIIQFKFYPRHHVAFDHMSSIAQSATQTTSKAYSTFHLASFNIKGPVLKLSIPLFIQV